jgi:hypothetical protein
VHFPDIDAVHEQMYSETVVQCMHGCVFGNGGLLKPQPPDIPKPEIHFYFFRNEVGLNESLGKTSWIYKLLG